MVAAMETKSIEYRGRAIGGLRVYSLSDWTNKDREPTDSDLRLINVTAAADAVRDILKSEPKKVGEEEPDKPWVTVVVREVCAALAGSQDGKLEEDVLMMYVNRHGMNQILEIWGADVGKLAEELARMSGVDDVPDDN